VLSGATRLVGLIGNPISGSLSPRMQNAAFAARGLDWAYVPLPVAEGRLEAAVAGLVALGFAGANVTIPYKTRVLAFCDELDPVAERAGSVNTLVIDGQGRVLGSSTDGEAVTQAVETAGRRVLVLGAGGAAQAVATALLDAGVAELLLSARRPQAAHALKGRLLALAPAARVAVVEPWPPRQEADVVVNCTPVRDDPLVELRPEMAVVDLAYRADGAPTALVQAAAAAGCRPLVDGLEVLVRQGAASFQRWTGLPAPIEVMRAALRP
jgi:shikimate dehydrogenase